MMTEFNSPQPDTVFNRMFGEHPMTEYHRNMKVYSWNVYCFNRSLPEVTKYIRDLDFDVLCLQEVPEELLTELKRLPYHLTSHVDVFRVFPGKRTRRDYVVILSKHPPLQSGTLQFFNFPFPLHTKLFIGLMSFVGWSFVTERGAVYADIAFNDNTLRVFSVHLTLWGAGRRADEFGVVRDHVEPGSPTVIAGDFNVVEFGPLKILNWLLGGPLREGMPWYPERDFFEERFQKAGFTNPLRGLVTHKFSRSQLDHILVSKEIRAHDPHIEMNTHGSDHAPVSVSITLAQ